MWQPIATSVIFYRNENRDGLNCFQNLCIKVYSGFKRTLRMPLRLKLAMRF